MNGSQKLGEWLDALVDLDETERPEDRDLELPRSFGGLGGLGGLDWLEPSKHLTSTVLEAAAAATQQNRAPLKNVVFPSWVKGWNVELAAASATEEEWQNVEGVPGNTKLKLQAETSGEGGGQLVLTWDSDLFIEGGWFIELYLMKEGRPELAHRKYLGDQPQGTAILTTDELGFDPVLTAIAFKLVAST